MRAALLIIMLLLTACGGPQGAPVSGEPLPPMAETPLTAESVEGRPIDDLLVLVFREDLDTDEWADVFSKAARFTRLRSESRSLARRDAALYSEAISSNTLETARILYDLYMHDTAYFLNITAAQGCRIAGGAVACGESAATSPGFPAFTGPVTVERLRRDGRVTPPALVLHLATPEGAGLRLELLPEINGDELVFKGQVVVGPQARFTRQDLPIQHHSIGYAEMRLRP